jgi:phage recombination protein Bet
MNELITNPVIDDKFVVNYLTKMEIGKDLSEVQKYEFIEKCKIWQLNPFKKEIYPIIRKQKDVSVLTIVIGYEVYLRQANQSNVWNGFEATFEGDIFLKDTKDKWNNPITIIDKDKSTLTCTIEIFRKDWQRSFKHKVWLSEFAPNQTGIWTEKPRFMLQKVGMCQAFRMCFNECQGLPMSDLEETTVSYINSDDLPPKTNSERDLMKTPRDNTIANLKKLYGNKDIPDNVLIAIDNAKTQQELNQIEIDIEIEFGKITTQTPPPDAPKPETEEKIPPEQKDPANQSNEQESYDEAKALKEAQDKLNKILADCIVKKTCGVTCNDEALQFVLINLEPAEKVKFCTDTNKILRAIITLEHRRLKYDPTHLRNSVKEYLLTESGTLADCDDTELLTAYIGHLAEKK